jgi:hypothetical protein
MSMLRKYVCGKTDADQTPPAIKIDLEQKKKFNQKELVRRIDDNAKTAEVLRKRLNKIS